MRLPPAEVWYEVEELEHDIARIDEVQLHEFARSNIWLVRGSERVLLVDTGTGLGPLREVVGTVTARPVIAFATTGYYDHAGGLHQFDSRLIHRLEADRVRHPSPRRVVSDKYLTTTAFKALPEAGFDPAGYRMVPTTPTRLVEDGDVIDLGDRKLEVIHLPGITPGTCGLLERESGSLFTGEALSYDNGHLYDGEPPDYTNDANPEAFKASLQRMLRLPVKQVYPGHYTCFDGARLAEIVAGYLAGRTRSKFG